MMTDMDREKRLALLLADGTGDFDFVHLAAFEAMVILKGHVNSHVAKQKAEDLARYAGFTNVANELRVYPESEAG